MNIIWFKRDLRIDDHPALSQAAKGDSVLPLYTLEPELWRQADMSRRHYLFLQQCLRDLDQDLAKIGQRLIIKVGSAVEVLDNLHQRYTIRGLWSHQETWNGWSYERDKAVKRWAKTHHIRWCEPVQNGVIRCLDNRHGWAARWYQQMNKPILARPSDLQPLKEPSDILPSCVELGLDEDVTSLQAGGRSEGLKLLHSFLYQRGQHYTKAMSSPVTAFDSCSRLSAHLAFGTLSLREVFQACQQRNQELKRLPSTAKGKWPSALRSFSGRLRWHCHFYAKIRR